jgi:hypothetical protein
VLLAPGVPAQVPEEVDGTALATGRPTPAPGVLQARIHSGEHRGHVWARSRILPTSDHRNSTGR